jgi:hypothetical protein
MQEENTEFRYGGVVLDKEQGDIKTLRVYWQWDASCFKNAINITMFS